MMVEIKKVKTPSELRSFVKMPFSLYKNHAFWVPPLVNDEVNTLDQQKNPVFKHCDAAYFLAYKNSEVAGRIAVFTLPVEEYHQEKSIGRFGWIDFIKDRDVLEALLSAGADWLKNQGVTGMKGPMGFTNLDKAGTLIEGFDELSTAASIYNYAYYPKLFEEAGFEKLVDYVEYEATVPEEIPERIHSFARIIQERYDIQIAKDLTKERIAEYGRELFRLLNKTHAHLSGFVPISEEQIELYVKKYLPMVKPEYLCIITNRTGDLLGFGIAMPSFSKALQKARGRLWPFGFFHLWRARRKSERADLMLIGIRPDMQNKGLPALIFYKIMKAFIDNGVKKVETNPELESNERVQNLWREYEMRQHKRRRIFVKSFD